MSSVSLFKLNNLQIKAIAELLIELGKWLLLAVVFSSIFSTAATKFVINNVILALSWSLILIIIAIRLLKEVKQHE